MLPPLSSDLQALIQEAPPAPRAGGATMQAEALFFGHTVGPEAVARIGFLARVAEATGQLSDSPCVREMRVITEAIRPQTPCADYQVDHEVRSVVGRRLHALTKINLDWCLECFQALADCAAAHLALAMPATEVSDCLSRALLRLTTALDAPTVAPGWNRSLHQALRAAVAGQLERSAIANADWRATVTHRSGRPPRVATSNPAIAVLQYLHAVLPDDPSVSLWPASSIEVVAPAPPRSRVVAWPRATTRRAVDTVRASVALAGASALTLLEDSPRAWLRRVEALATCPGPTPASREQSQRIATRIQQWGPREWRRVPRAHAALLAQQLEGVDAPELAALFRAHAARQQPPLRKR